MDGIRVTEKQESLLSYMRFLSNRYYSEPWANGIEYSLWHWLYTPDACPLTDAERHQLYHRHLLVDGWFVSASPEPEFWSRKSWIKHYITEFQEEARKFIYE